MTSRLKNRLLANHTTFKIGGPVEILSIPKNKKELLGEINYCINNNIKYRILGNGSNILVKDEGVDGMVIKNTKALNYIHKKGNRVIVGSSVMLFKFVNYCIKNNLEGMEYLVSVPGTIGGAIYMNAGRGQSDYRYISNKLESVKIFNGKKTINLLKKDLKFSYRQSIFHKRKEWTILEATFLLENQKKEIGVAKIKERINEAYQKEIWKYPSAGSIYKEKSIIVLKLLKNLRVGGCQFSQFQPNTIFNIDNASARDVLRLLKISRLLHFFLFKKPILEIEIWE